MSRLCGRFKFRKYLGPPSYALFCDSTQRRMAVSYQRFGTTHRSYLPRIMQSSWTAWSLRMERLGWPETLVINYHSTLCRVPNERRSNSHRRGSLKSLTFHEPTPPHTHTKNPVPLNSGNQEAANSACGVRRMKSMTREHHLSLLFSCAETKFWGISGHMARAVVAWKKKRRHLGVTTLQSVTRRIFLLFFKFLLHQQRVKSIIK